MQREIDERVVISAAAQRISGLIRSTDLAAPVLHLGRWKVRDVVAHLGGVHRWATRIVNTRSMDGPSFTKSKLTGTELCDWFDAGVEDLLAALNTNKADDQCPNFNPGSPNTVAWWSRRLTHETTVHRWDVERALGCTSKIDPVVAADGIGEYLDVFVRTRGKQTLIAPLALVTTQPSRAWTLSPATRPGRVDIVEGRAAEATAQVVGRPETLLLVLWGRLGFSEAHVETHGDPLTVASLIGPP